MLNNSNLKLVSFSDIQQWDVKFFFQTKVKSKYKISTIGEHTIHITKKVKLFEEPEKKFKILGISNEIGMFDAYEEYGKNINQPYIYVEKDCLAYNPYRVNVGSIGIKTESLQNDFISPAYVVFKCKDTLLPEYLFLLMKSSVFNGLIKENTTGAVRQTLSYDKLANIPIPLPSIEKQKELVDLYNDKRIIANEKAEKIVEIKNRVDYLIMETLNIHNVEPLIDDGKLMKIVLLSDFTKNWEWNQLSKSIKKAMDDCFYPVKSLSQLVSFVNRPWKKKEIIEDNFMYIELGGVDANSNIALANSVSVSKAPSRATQIVKTGDLIIGTTRPYLKKFAIIDELQNNYVCSSGFQVIEPSEEYDIRFILEMLKFETTIKQFEILMTGALYPAVNFEQLKEIKIPFPPLDVQKSIADSIQNNKNAINVLFSEIEMIKKLANKEFEEAVFKS